MRLRPVRNQDPPPPPAPFPIRLYLVGIGNEGTEVLRFDLNCSFIAYGETVHLPNPTLELLRE